MEETTAVVTQVKAWEEGANGSVVLRTGDGGEYSVDRKDPRYAIWSRIASEERAKGHVIYVLYRPDSRQVRWISRFYADQIQWVAPEPEADRLRVGIFGSPSIYHLKTTRPGYEERRKLVEESARTKKPLLVVTSDLEILEARWP
jgi:hypothetical protein